MPETFYMLETADDANLVTDDDLMETLDWFSSTRGVPADELFDRLFSRSGPKHPSGAALDLGSTDNPAARRILARARQLKRERDA